MVWERSTVGRYRKPGISPISRIPCVFWRITAKYYSTGKFPGWTVLCSRDSKNPFFIADYSGRILVVPEGARIEIPLYISYEGYCRKMNRRVRTPHPWMNAYWILLNHWIPWKRNRSLSSGDKISTWMSILSGKTTRFLCWGLPSFRKILPARNTRIGLIISHGGNDASYYISDSLERDVEMTVSFPYLCTDFRGPHPFRYFLLVHAPDFCKRIIRP